MFAGDVPALAAIVPTPMHSEHSLQKHRQKNYVHADERGPEMHFSPELVHHSAGRFGEPIVDAGEQGENRARRDDVMEVRDDVISVVEIEISGIKCEGDAS